MRWSIATLLLLVLPLTACHRWIQPEVDPDVRPDRPATHDRVRVRTVDGGSRVLRHVQVRPDSVVGYFHPPNSPRPPRRLAFGRDQVAALEVRRPDPLATVLGIGGVVFLGLTLACLVDNCLDVALGGWGD